MWRSVERGPAGGVSVIGRGCDRCAGAGGWAEGRGGVVRRRCFGAALAARRFTAPVARRPVLGRLALLLVVLVDDVVVSLRYDFF